MAWQALVAQQVMNRQGGSNQSTGGGGSTQSGGSGGGGFGFGDSSSDQGDIRTGAINVQPVGLNLGAILQPFTESPSAGGFGYSPPSPFAVRGADFTPFVAKTPIENDLTSSATLPLLLGVGGVLTLGTLLVVLTKPKG